MHHLTKFKELVEVMEHFGIKMFNDECCVGYEKKDLTKSTPIATTDQYSKRVRDKRIAICFLRRSNLSTYGRLLRELRDNYLHGMDLYPNNLEEAFSLLQNHSTGKLKKKHPKTTKLGQKPRKKIFKPVFNIMLEHQGGIRTIHYQRTSGRNRR